MTQHGTHKHILVVWHAILCECVSHKRILRSTSISSCVSSILADAHSLTLTRYACVEALNECLTLMFLSYGCLCPNHLAANVPSFFQQTHRSDLHLCVRWYGETCEQFFISIRTMFFCHNGFINAWTWYQLHREHYGLFSLIQIVGKCIGVVHCVHVRLPLKEMH